jgi:diaminopimelate decarboxylase
VLLTRVLYVNHGGGKRFVITAAGVNDLLRPSHYFGFHAVEPIESRERVYVDVLGPICETGDFLALERDMERVEPGELLAIRTVGAYGFSMSSTYNQSPGPAEAMAGDEASLARRREAVEDLLAAEMDSCADARAGILPLTLETGSREQARQTAQPQAACCMHPVRLAWPGLAREPVAG